MFCSALLRTTASAQRGSLAAKIASIEQVKAASWYAKPKLSPKPKPAPPRPAPSPEPAAAAVAAAAAAHLEEVQLFEERFLEELKQSFEQSVVQHVQLQTQLLAQQEEEAKQTELIAQSMQASGAERVDLQGRVERLHQDLHALTEQMLKEQVGVRERIQRKGVKGRGGQSRMAYRPTIANAEKQPTHVCEMSHQSLAELAMLGNHCARRERVIREIMAVEGITWGRAHEVLSKLDAYNERYYWIESMPYRIGITCAFIGGVLGSMMVFYKPVALWYGEQIAGEELPEGVKDISEMTTNQVGTWTWGWMEPMIGTASFVLLCAQFGRAQVMKMNMKTYADHLLTWRANRLAAKFPELDGSMVRAWAKHMPPVGLNFLPIYERRAGYKGFTSGL